MSSKTRQQLEKWIVTLPVSGKVLDVGGSQLPVRGRINAPEGTEFTVLDLAIPHVVKEAPAITQDLNEQIDSMKGNAFEYFDKFDFAFCLEVSEYWFDPKMALENINFLMKKGGTLYISFHFIYPVHEPMSLDFMRYTRNGAVKLLESAGFKVKRITGRKADYGMLQAFYHGEGMRASKMYADHDEVGVLIEAIKI